VNVARIGDIQVKVKKSHYDRQSIGQSVLVSGAHLGPTTNFSFFLRFSFRQLRVCYFAESSLTRGRVCNLLLLLVLASAVPLGSALSDKRTDLYLLLLLGLASGVPLGSALSDERTGLSSLRRGRVCNYCCCWASPAQTR
jgi:hypothetical protein